jgi:predicted nucleic acid-binding protein
MFDTNIFNAIVDSNTKIELNPNFNYYATEIQLIELRNTKNEQRRSELIKIFNLVEPKIIESKSAIWGKFPWGNRDFGYVSQQYISMFTCLENIKKKRGNGNDSLIAEIAIIRELILVTSDKDLENCFKLNSKKIMNFNEFLEFSDI